VRVRLAGLRAEVHGAQAQTADGQAGTAQMRVFHWFIISPGPTAPDGATPPVERTGTLRSRTGSNRTHRPAGPDQHHHQIGDGLPGDEIEVRGGGFRLPCGETTTTPAAVGLVTATLSSTADTLACESPHYMGRLSPR